MNSRIRTQGLWTVVVLAAFVCGCTITPRGAVSMPVQMPEAFSTTGTDALPEKWWHSFEDSVLDALIEEGLSGNFSIRSAWDRLRQAEQAAVKAGADLLPEVNYDGSARRTRQDYSDQVTYSNLYGAGMTVSYEADLWGRVKSVEQAAALDAMAAQEDAAAAAVTLSAAIAKAWYQRVEAGLQELLIAGQVETNEQVLSIITLQFRQGQVGASNVFRQRQLVEATRGQLIAARERTVLLEHQLAILLGKIPGVWKAADSGLLISLPPLPATGVPTELLQRRPDLRSAGNAVASADRRVYAAMADQYPRISLFAEAGTDASRAGDLFDDWAATLAANLIGPLYDGNRRRAETERTRAVLSERINTYTQRTLAAIGEVEDALQQEHYQRQIITNLQQQLDLAGQVYERTRESYLKVQLDYLRVLEALVSRQTLERNELTARRVLIERRVDLCRALAGSWEMSRPEPAALEPDPHLSMRTMHD